MSDNTLNPMESKNIKDYLHLYLNQQVQVRKKNDSDREYLQGRICEVTKSSNHGDWIKVWFDDIHTVTNSTWDQLTSNAHTFFIGEDEIKLILRPLSDMTEEEEIQLQLKFHPNGFLMDAMANEQRYFSFETMRQLLSKGFDIFNLIDAGLAIKKSQ